MVRGKSQDAVANQLDMTPMVDVTFLLLIFFMVTASFVLQKSLAVSPPEANGSVAGLNDDLLAEESIRVEIDGSNTIRVEGSAVETHDEVLAAIRQEMASQARTSLLVATHPESLHGRTIRVLDAAQAAKIQTIRQQLDESI